MPDLTEDELAVLMIAARGESMIAIGRWEQPINHLVQMGLLLRHDKANHTITPAGREVLQAEEKITDKALGGLIESSSRVGAAQKSIRDFAEQAAQLLAEASRESARITGDRKEYAAQEWSRIILNRALELLTGTP